MKRIEKTYRYRGWNTGGGQCGLEILDPPGGALLMVLTQLPWNTNTSVSNMVEILAAEAALEHLPDRERSRSPFRCIEHLYSWPVGEDRFELVTFEWPWPRGRKGWDRPILGKPRWQKLNCREIEALIGEPYVERFRRVRRVAPPNETTIEAVRLLRTYFGQLAKCHGPLAAALGRKDLPVVESPESAGQLYVTELAEWLFFPDGEIGVKLLGDETVASRWDLWELTRELLRSARQIAEIFLTHIELPYDHAGFASALVDYFAYPEKLTVEIIESQAESSKLWLEARQRETTPWELSEHQLRYGPWEGNSVRKKLETSLLCGATLVAVAIEAVLVWRLWLIVRSTPDPLAFYLGDWLSPLLPALSLAGVAAAMIHRLGLALAERERAGEHWHEFRRLAYSFLALASAGGSTLYISFGRFLR